MVSGRPLAPFKAFSHLRGMLLRRTILFLTALTFLALPIAVHARSEVAATRGRVTPAEKIHIHGISDSGMLNKFLYRGTQPKPGRH